MKKIPTIATVIAFVVIAASTATAHEAPAHEHNQLVPIPPYSQTHGSAGAEAALQAAAALLSGFDESAKARFMFGLDAPERAGWSNLPAKFVQRSGLSVGDMSDGQRTLLFAFLSASLGAEGYESVMEVMAAEAFLSGDSRAAWIKWAPKNYWFSLYGVPSADGAWGWQYSGHHLTLNMSIKNGVVESMSPSFVGAEPAHFTYNGVEYTAVVDMHEAGYAVYQSLDDDQQAAAATGDVPDDVQTGPGKDGTIPPVIGLAAAGMTAAQRRLLLAAINEWVSIQPDENAATRMAEIERRLDETHFAWTGTTETNSPSYMRIQGPTLIIELLSSEGNVGQSAAGLGHYHTIYRNPANEYGR